MDDQDDGNDGTLAPDAGRLARFVKARGPASTAQHKYHVGDSVSYLSGRSRILPKTRDKRGQDGNFEVVSKLPNEGMGFQYRIKNIADGQERVVAEAEISPRPFL